MENNHRVILFIVIGIALIGAAIYFREHIFVAISSVWAGAMILLGRLRSFFGGSTSERVEELESRLTDARRIERELIETLMQERIVFRQRLQDLEQQGADLDRRIAASRESLDRFETFETWEEGIWAERTPAEQQRQREAVFGEFGSLQDFEF